MTSIRRFVGAALFAGASTMIVAPVAAAPIGHPFAIERPATDLTQQVFWRGGWGWGPGAFVGGLAAGAIVGGALAAPYYYGSPYYYGPGYAVPAYAPPPGDALTYCMQRYRSYDPNTGTFLGKDGQRHPCP
jgi:hypothetical protein